MSLFKVTSFVVVLAAAGALSACGFKPLYGNASVAGPATEAHMALISVGTIEDRLGQMLHNELLERLNPKGAPAKPQYSLIVKVGESIGSLSVQKSGDATRANLTLSATYSLYELGAQTGGGVDSITSGNIKIISSYDISSAEFTTLYATRNARANAVREAADDIRIRLAVFFTQQE